MRTAETVDCDQTRIAPKEAPVRIVQTKLMPARPIWAPANAKAISAILMNCAGGRRTCIPDNNFTSAQNRNPRNNNSSAIGPEMLASRS